MAQKEDISATMVGAIGFAEAKSVGWFGKIFKPDGHVTSNIGLFGGWNSYVRVMRPML